MEPQSKQTKSNFRVTTHIPSSTVETHLLKTSDWCSLLPVHVSQRMISVNFTHSAAIININAPYIPSSTCPSTEEIKDSLREGEERAYLPVQLGSFPSILQPHVTSWRRPALQFHNARGMWTWPGCPHTWMHTVPTHNRWLCWSCLWVYSNMCLILSFTHHLMFGEEFIHLSASGPSQGFQRWTFADEQSNAVTLTCKLSTKTQSYSKHRKLKPQKLSQYQIK